MKIRKVIYNLESLFRSKLSFIFFVFRTRIAVSAF